MSDESTTYGPAQERRTRTPITFKTPVDTGGEGQYENPASLFGHILALAHLTGPETGSIQIDPTLNQEPGQLSRTIRHEAIHSALLNSANRGQFSQAAAETPNFQEIARALSQRGRAMVGRPSAEVPAYMGAYNQQESGVPQDWRDEYIAALKQKLFAINPRIGAIYNQLSAPGAK